MPITYFPRITYVQTVTGDSTFTANDFIVISPQNNGRFHRNQLNSALFAPKRMCHLPISAAKMHTQLIIQWNVPNAAIIGRTQIQSIKQLYPFIGRNDKLGHLTIYSESNIRHTLVLYLGIAADTSSTHCYRSSVLANFYRSTWKRSKLCGPTAHALDPIPWLLMSDDSVDGNTR
jgi:hypothetical protein